MATEIKTGTGLTTLINVFETTPEQQGPLLRILQAATDEEICKRPGFVSANLHRSLDGLRVVNYIQWESPEAWRAMLEDPACRRHIDEVERMVTPDPHEYEVVSTHAPAAAGRRVAS